MHIIHEHLKKKTNKLLIKYSTVVAYGIRRTRVGDGDFFKAQKLIRERRRENLAD